MACRGCTGGHDCGNLGYGCPKGTRGGSTKKGREGLSGRGPLSGGCCSMQVEDLENPGHAAGTKNSGQGQANWNCFNQGGNVSSQEKELNYNHDDEVLDRLQELEVQVKMIRTENLECKNVLLRLYNLVSTGISENRGQNSVLFGKFDHLEASLDLAFSRRARTREVTAGELEEISGKITKLQKHMEGNGNYVDLRAEKSKTEDPAEAFKNGCQK